MNYSRLAFIVSLVLCQPVFAQVDEQEVEKITVTTQKREQSIQDVPVAITAFNREFLERLCITELDVLSEVTPGLIFKNKAPFTWGGYSWYYVW